MSAIEIFSINKNEFETIIQLYKNNEPQVPEVIIDITNLSSFMPFESLSSSIQFSTQFSAFPIVSNFF